MKNDEIYGELKNISIKLENILYQYEELVNFAKETIIINNEVAGCDIFTEIRNKLNETKNMLVSDTDTKFE